jgi:plastocyanin
MQAPYKMDYDLAGGESTTFSFNADTVGSFTYYCTYDLPSMVGQLLVLP